MSSVNLLSFFFKIEQITIYVKFRKSELKPVNQDSRKWNMMIIFIILKNERKDEKYLLISLGKARRICGESRNTRLGIWSHRAMALIFNGSCEKSVWNRSSRFKGQKRLYLGVNSRLDWMTLQENTSRAVYLTHLIQRDLSNTVKYRENFDYTHAS